MDNLNEFEKEKHTFLTKLKKMLLYLINLFLIFNFYTGFPIFGS